ARGLVAEAPGRRRPRASRPTPRSRRRPTLAAIVWGVGSARDDLPVFKETRRAYWALGPTGIIGELSIGIQGFGDSAGKNGGSDGPQRRSRRDNSRATGELGASRRARSAASRAGPGLRSASRAWASWISTSARSGR